VPSLHASHRLPIDYCTYAMGSRQSLVPFKPSSFVKIKIQGRSYIYLGQLQHVISRTKQSKLKDSGTSSETASYRANRVLLVQANGKVRGASDLQSAMLFSDGPAHRWSTRSLARHRFVAAVRYALAYAQYVTSSSYHTSNMPNLQTKPVMTT
jgi:hypothetical protein